MNAELSVNCCATTKNIGRIIFVMCGLFLMNYIKSETSQNVSCLLPPVVNNDQRQAAGLSFCLIVLSISDGVLTIVSFGMHFLLDT